MAKASERSKVSPRAPGGPREALVEATLVCLRRFGHEGMSVRQISAQAGVSAGLINHHFPSITALVAAAYDTLATSLLHSIRRQAHDLSKAPRERLRGSSKPLSLPNCSTRVCSAAWLVFLGMVSHDAEMRGRARPYLRRPSGHAGIVIGTVASDRRNPAFKLRPPPSDWRRSWTDLWIEAA